MSLFLTVALGLTAIATGVRLMPMSVMLLLAAVGIPKLLPNASPRRVARVGFLSLALGLVMLVALLDVGSGAEIVTWPLMFAGFGAGALASQLGAVTVGAVSDERSGEVGGLQNTATNLGSSIATALMGAVLISALTSTFLSGLADNPDVPRSVTENAAGPARRRRAVRVGQGPLGSARRSERANGHRRRDRRGEHRGPRPAPCRWRSRCSPCSPSPPFPWPAGCLGHRRRRRSRNPRRAPRRQREPRTLTARICRRRQAAPSTAPTTSPVRQV